MEIRSPDAYRPWHVTKMFWDATPDNLKDFVANPANGSRHNRGCAVDLTLYDLETGERLWKQRGFETASCILAGDKLLILDYKGELTLATPQFWKSPGAALHSNTRRCSFLYLCEASKLLQLTCRVFQRR